METSGEERRVESPLTVMNGGAAFGNGEWDGAI